jgi:hypothetical protein
VVLPTPPFWFAMVKTVVVIKTEGINGDSCRCASTAKRQRN